MNEKTHIKKERKEFIKWKKENQVKVNELKQKLTKEDFNKEDIEFNLAFHFVIEKELKNMEK